MDIKQACNTPVLINKVIGSSKISEISTGSIRKQSIIINSDTSLYTTNSPINITSVEISYSDLGLLNPPVLSTSTDGNNLNLLKYSYDSSIKTTMPSILDDNSEVKNKYDNILYSVSNSINSQEYVCKETYLLLSLQSLIDFIIKSCDTFLTCSKLKSYETKIDSMSIIKGLFNSLLCLSNGIKLLNTLIGQNVITTNYACKVIHELSSSLLYIESQATALSDNENFNINDDTLDLINSSIKECNNCLLIDNTSKILFSQFTDVISHLINCINLITTQLQHLESYVLKEPLLNIIPSLQSVTKLVENATSSISLAYSDIANNYNTIVNNLKQSCDYAKTISINSGCPNLSTNFNSNVLLTKSFSKDFTNIDIPNSSDTDTNNNPDCSNITESVALSLSFYVYNLRINVSGTIGSENFTGHIFYPELHNLSFFGIHDMTINAQISIPSDINTFNISQNITPKLEVTNITAASPYNKSTFSTFNSDIELTLSINGEILATALLPLIIVK